MRNTIFFTGAPGSRWSGVAQQIGKLPNVNHSDENPNRSFEHSAIHGSFSGHKGSYFGPGMEFGANFDQIPKLLPFEIQAEVDRAFPDKNQEQLRIVKGHIFSYYLDSLRRVFPDSMYMMVWRDSDVSLKWWLELGGFSIPYPRYEWYVNEETMKRRIQEENRAIEGFCDRNRISLEPFTPEWVEKNFGRRLDFDPAAYFTGVKVALAR